MPILTTMEIHGDTDELMKQHRETIDPVAQPLFEENGGISHTVVEIDEGIMIVNLWENEEGMEKTAAGVKPTAEAAAATLPQNWTLYKVLHHQPAGR